ncbi:hemerythrin domain-containing protein [Kribbella qitaiheensis]|uniref:Hemerythrin domain-containing protein n=1 Tax=Kribbella qitaiheensis TaxID=1544730 RepID=A0A7G6WTU1_9ACTN|nr:hemerythrin domain-containing protein [Kribbella qitaiheensis]QNE17406.1 hemerythrin domain-containing protein [Kribbella qitaiheensis]
MAADVVDLIMQDHREVERLFDELKNHPEKRVGLVPVLTTLLFAHSRAEESEVYPAAAAEADEADEVAHSQEEHVEADQLLAKLAATDPESADFDKALRNLVDAVTHHVEEEETKVLPGMSANLSQERRLELGEAFAASRKEHLGEQPDDITRDELLQQARNADVSGVSSLGKDALQKKLQQEASE